VSVLHLLLRDRDIDGVRQAALAIGAVIFSALNVTVLHATQPSGFWQFLLAVLASTLSLAVVVRGLERILLASWASPVLGTWVYRSSSENWGLAIISLRGGELNYSVQLYQTQDDVMAAVREESSFVARCFATVSAVGVTYEKGQVELIYKINQAHSDYQLRSGMLTLSPLSPSTMKGYWKSDILGQESSRGTLDMYRPHALRSTDVG
jgi:hypothetical protein